MIDKKYPVKVVVQNIDKHLIRDITFQGTKSPSYAIVGVKIGEKKVNINAGEKEKTILFGSLSLNEIKETRIYIQTIEYTPYVSNNMVRNCYGSFTREVGIRGENSVIFCELPKEIPLCTENKNGYEFIIDISGYTTKNEFGEFSFPIKIIPIEIDFAAELEKERIAQENKPFDWSDYFRNKPASKSILKDF